MSNEMTQQMVQSAGFLPMTTLQHACCFALDMAGLRNLREVANYIRASDISEGLKVDWLAALDAAIREALKQPEQPT